MSSEFGPQTSSPAKKMRTQRANKEMHANSNETWREQGEAKRPGGRHILPGEWFAEWRKSSNCPSLSSEVPVDAVQVYCMRILSKLKIEAHA